MTRDKHHKDADPLLIYIANETGMEVTQAELLGIMRISKPTYKRRRDDMAWTADDLIAVARQYNLHMGKLLEGFGIASTNELMGIADSGQVSHPKALATLPKKARTRMRRDLDLSHLGE